MLGPRAQIAAERVAFEQVENILGNGAPAVRDFVDLGDRAGIEYAFASMGDGDVRTPKGLYAAGEDPVPVLTRAFDEVLGRFHTVVTYEALPLLKYYGFEARFAPGVRARAAALFGPMGDEVELAPGYSAPHVARFYETLDELPPLPGESHFVSYVHGDLNGANVLVDARDNVWLIDFFHAHRGHAIKDLVKLENDLLYLFTPVETAAELTEAIAMSRALRWVKDLAAPLPEAAPEGVRSPALVRAWTVLRWLRARMARLVQSDRDPAQLSLALLRYAVHTLSFDEASHLQKRWAFAAACGHAEDFATARREERALRVDWLAAPAELGLTICPGRSDRGRDLDADLSALRALGVTDLICLSSAGELDRVGVPALFARAVAAGLGVFRCPVPDQGVPTPSEARALVDHISARLAAGGRVVVHCMGGLGRSGLVAGCVLRARGLSGTDAIAAVRSARGPRAIETPAQEAFVAAYASA